MGHCGQVIKSRLMGFRGKPDRCTDKAVCMHDDDEKTLSEWYKYSTEYMRRCLVHSSAWNMDAYYRVQSYHTIVEVGGCLTFRVSGLESLLAFGPFDWATNVQCHLYIH